MGLGVLRVVGIVPRVLSSSQTGVTSGNLGAPICMDPRFHARHRAVQRTVQETTKDSLASMGDGVCCRGTHRSELGNLHLGGQFGSRRRCRVGLFH